MCNAHCFFEEISMATRQAHTHTATHINLVVNVSINSYSLFRDFAYFETNLVSVEVNCNLNHSKMH